MTAIAIRRYSAQDKKDWNDFIAGAKNATFLFNREYMDYHSDRFIDHSLLVYLDDKLAAVFVANEDGNTIHSHAGLTYGGLVLKPDARLEMVACFFFHILRYYHTESFTSISYKCFPSYFTKYPSYEDQYVLFLLNAELVKREASCVYSRIQPLPYRENREKSVIASKKNSFKIRQVNSPINFWTQVLEPNLDERFGAKPAHSAAEMELLMSRFPSDIKLYEVHDGDLLAGAVIYEMETVAHVQYLSTTKAGRERGALDVLVDELIGNIYNDKASFSLGTSNTNNGRLLNRGLMNWKEGFGARAWPHDFYMIQTANYTVLGSYE